MSAIEARQVAPNVVRELCDETSIPVNGLPEMSTDLMQQQTVIDLQCVHRTQRHPRGVRFMGVLNDRGPARKRDGTKPVGAVIEITGQDNSDGPTPECRR